jgi:hypothetical protein
MSEPGSTECLYCENKALWLRVTQFAGTHPFCDEHAKRENDFGQDGGSYFYWEKLAAQAC